MINTRLLQRGVGLAGTLLALVVPHAAFAQAGTVLAGYATNVDANQDHMTMTVNNLTATDFTNVTVTELLPATASDPAVSDTFNFGTVAANGSLDLDLSVLPDFGRDPAHTAPFLTPFDVTVTAQEGAILLSTTFNQDNNATGGFVGFEGVGEGGNAPYLPVAPTQVGILAPVPEVSTTVSLGLFIVGLGGLALRTRRRA